MRSFHVQSPWQQLSLPSPLQYRAFAPIQYYPTKVFLKICTIACGRSANWKSFVLILAMLYGGFLKGWLPWNPSSFSSLLHQNKRTNFQIVLDWTRQWTRLPLEILWKIVFAWNAGSCERWGVGWFKQAFHFWLWKKRQLKKFSWLMHTDSFPYEKSCSVIVACRRLKFLNGELIHSVQLDR